MKRAENRTPRVDVVIPNYNYADFLPACVNSVVSQDIDDLRITIIDNASEDKSLEIARAIAELDQRISVIEHATNVGPHRSFNEAIDLAGGDYLMILCADDVLLPGSLRFAFDAMERHPEACFAIGAEATITNDGCAERHTVGRGWRLVSGQAFIERCCRSLGFSLALGMVLVRIGIQKEVGHYLSSLPYTDDLHMALRLAARGSIVELEAPLGLRRLHDRQMSNLEFASHRVRLHERAAAFSSFFSGAGRALPQALHRAAVRRLAGVAFRSAVREVTDGDWRSAVGLLSFAASLASGREDALLAGGAASPPELSES